MDIQSALYSGMQGFSRASAGVTDASREINRQSQQNQQNDAGPAVAETAAPVAALTDSLVRLGQEERNAQANVKSIQTADEVLGTVIDIRV